MSWRIHHIDLSEPLPLLSREPAAPALLVFWYGPTPLGQRVVPAGDLPHTPDQLARLAAEVVVPSVGFHLVGKGYEPPLPLRHPPARAVPELDALQKLENPLSTFSTSQGLAPSARDVSIVICTRERPDDLARCLRSLRGLTSPPREVIVVDNAPRSDATRRVAEAEPGVRYVIEPRAGLSAARNRGILESTGAIVAFTDDDVIVHPGWIAGLKAAFALPDASAVTGLVLPAELETEAQILFEQRQGGEGWGYRRRLFDASFYAQMKRWGVPVWQIGAGANMAFRRAVLDELGGFDERLGAGAAGCSEDSEMWYRLLHGGHACVYEPAAVVYHHHRRSLDALDDQMYQYMRGHVAALLMQFDRYGDRGNLYRAFTTLPGHYAKRLVRHALGRRSPREAMLGPQLRGCAAGVAYYWRHRKTPVSAETLPAPHSLENVTA